MIPGIGDWKTVQVECGCTPPSRWTRLIQGPRLSLLRIVIRRDAAYPVLAEKEGRQKDAAAAGLEEG
jgi:hypothetical protein